MRNVVYLAALIAFSVGIDSAQAISIQAKTEKSSGVVLSFRECVGGFSVFVLENHLKTPIYARVQRVDYWDEYKKGNMELGVHYVERVPPPPPQKYPSLGPWDAPPAFRKIGAGVQVRYAIQIPDDKAEYRVRVPYMENGEVVRRLDEDTENLIKNEMPLVEASWKEVFSSVSANRCRK